MSHTAATEADLEVAREIRNLAKHVVAFVAVEERNLTRRDRAEDEGMADLAVRLQGLIDDAVEEYRALLEGRLLDLGVTKGESEDDDIQTCRIVADETVYAIRTTYVRKN